MEFDVKATAILIKAEYSLHAPDTIYGDFYKTLIESGCVSALSTYSETDFQFSIAQTMRNILRYDSFKAAMYIPELSVKVHTGYNIVVMAEEVIGVTTSITTSKTETMKLTEYLKKEDMEHILVME
jgi:hypothetical protein